MLLILFVAALNSPSPLDPPSSNITDAPNTSPQAQLSPGQQTVVAAAILGLTPQSLAASGFDDVETTRILTAVQTQNTFADLLSHAAAVDQRRHVATSGMSAPQGGSSSSGSATIGAASAPRDTLRVQVLAAAVTSGDSSRSDTLIRCAAGGSIGLPKPLAAACGTAADRRRASAAIIAEKRAAALGEPLAPRHADLLAALRANPNTARATQTLADRLSAIKARFADQSSSSP